MLGPSKNNGLPFLLLFLLSFLHVSFAYPAVSANDRLQVPAGPSRMDSSSSVGSVGPDGQRTPNSRWRQLNRDIAKGTQVNYNNAKFHSFSEGGPQAIGGSGFETSGGLVVAGTQGALVGQWGVDSKDIAEGVKVMAALMTEHKKELKGAKAWYYGKVELESPKKLLYPKQKSAFEELVKKELGITDVQVETFIEPSQKIPEDMDKMSQEDMEAMLKKQKKLMYGAVLVQVENKNTEPVVTFVDVKWQTSGR